MKKIIKLIGTFLFLIPLLTQASVTLNDTQIQTYVKQGYVVSDAYNSASVCSQTVVKYNQQYSSYNRSECFEINGSYKYFICDKSDSCTVTGTTTNELNSSQQNTTTTNTTTTTTITNVPYKSTLDAFLVKVKSLTSGTNFISVSNELLSKLDVLGSKYSSNSDISKMVVYLKSGIQDIQQEYSKDGDIQAFLADLANTSTSSSSSSTSSSSSSSGGTTVANCVAQTINGYSLAARVNGGVSVGTKTVSNNTYEQEFKCNSGTWETRGTETVKTTTQTNTCGTGKKSKGSVCVTDTSTVNPNGNYTLGQGACAVSNATTLVYNGSSYSGNLGSSFNSLNINNTLNSCIEACDIGYLNLNGLASTPRTDLNCFYEGQIIRKLPSGSITNVSAATNTVNPQYVNLVNGLGIAACNQQIVDKFGTQKYTCTIGGGCALNGLTVSSSNPSANPTQAGACIPKTEWDNAKATTTTPVNTCGTGKKLKGSLCVTDTSTVNPNGNYTLGQGACAVSNATTLVYNGSSYSGNLGSSFNSLNINNTLNSCIEACDIGYSNLTSQGTKPRTDLNCFYEGQIVRKLPSGNITNVSATTTTKTFTQAEVTAHINQIGNTNYDLIAKTVLDFEKQGYQNLRAQVAVALGTTTTVVNDYITNYQKGTSNSTSSSSSTGTTGWNIKTQGTTLCTSVGGGNIGMDGRLQSSTCNVGDVVYQRTNCTQGDINDKVIYMWTNYECVRK